MIHYQFISCLVIYLYNGKQLYYKHIVILYICVKQTTQGYYNTVTDNLQQYANDALARTDTNKQRIKDTVNDIILNNQNNHNDDVNDNNIQQGIEQTSDTIHPILDSITVTTTYTDTDTINSNVEHYVTDNIKEVADTDSDSAQNVYDHITDTIQHTISGRPETIDNTDNTVHTTTYDTLQSISDTVEDNLGTDTIHKAYDAVLDSSIPYTTTHTHTDTDTGTDTDTNKVSTDTNHRVDDLLERASELVSDSSGQLYKSTQPEPETQTKKQTITDSIRNIINNDNNDNIPVFNLHESTDTVKQSIQNTFDTLRNKIKNILNKSNGNSHGNTIADRNTDTDNTVQDILIESTNDNDKSHADTNTDTDTQQTDISDAVQ